jgi:hypothetical protein
MQLSKIQITALLTEVASQEDGFNEILRMSFEAMMKAERQEHLIKSREDKVNRFRQVKAYGRNQMRVACSTTLPGVGCSGAVTGCKGKYTWKKPLLYCIQMARPLNFPVSPK